MPSAIIAGGRDFTDKDFIYKELDSMQEGLNLDLVITGGARGVDTIAHSWANERKISTQVYKADWDRFGKMAGHLRNQQMADHLPTPYYCILFPGGPGTADMRRRAQAKGIVCMNIIKEL